MAGRGFKLADAYVDVHGDGTEVVSEVAADVEKAGGKAKGAGMSMGKKLVGGLIGAVAVAKIGGFISDSIGAASDLNETISASQQIFGKSAGAIEKWSDTAATKLGLSKQAAIDAATSFGDMFSQIGFSGDAAQKNSTKIVQMAADLGSFKNLPTGDVLDMISGAMRGEYDSLQRVIPNINAARVQHEAMTETGKKSASQLTAQEKAQATLNIIQKDGTRAMGDFARTSTGVANSQKIAAAQTEDLKASLGTSLLPIVQQVLGVITSTFLPMLKGVADWITKNKDVIGPLVIVFGLLAAAIWVVNVAMYANPVSLIIMGIIALIAVIVLVITNFDNLVKFGMSIFTAFLAWFNDVLAGFAAWWNGLWDSIFSFLTDAINNVIAWVTANWGLLLSIFIGPLGLVIQWIVENWSSIVQFFVDVWNGIVNYVKFAIGMMLSILISIGATISAVWNGLWSGVASFLDGIWAGIGAGARAVWSGLLGFFGGLGAKIMGVFRGALSWLSNIGRDIVNGLWDGISGAWNGFMDWWNSTVGGIADLAKSILGIHSPSLVMRQEVGVQVVKGTELGIEDGLPSLKRTVRNAFTFDTDALTAGVPGVGMGAGIPSKSKGGDTSIHVDNITIDASSIKEINDIIEMLKAIPQAARTGRGVKMAG